MVQALQRTAVSGPTLVRLLARLTAADVPASSQSLSDQLSQWLGWTDAIALSTALNSAPPAVASGARGAGSMEHECARVRASLADAIAGDSVLAPRRRRGSAHPQNAHNAQPPEAEANYADFRQRYLALQQAMETRIGSLRGRLRNMVAAQTSEMTRLAVVDAIMERSLGARERSLFGAVPGLLSGHFERLRQAAQAEHDAEVTLPTEAGTQAAPRPGAWLDVFRKDMQSVLLAELDIRFQPVEGLLAALRIS
ncbi:DUF3348 domain-containing protein [Paraburkholderia caribensis]|uniref:DUF3348 domain-containing protein n=1 Tax=Paraburkholderia caribensis TaxID=75105 RepID=UPI000720325E|nr:DUF3348 domain-containing protein [Paraburkholderia caribensis]ALP67000.1 hypothetical protein AN416_30220 [Paraburkholderia caribensis]AUT56703.1 DUF3348 domain-containing protein [Paraburkholderia caribensis]